MTAVSNCLRPVSDHQSETRLQCLQLSPLPIREETRRQPGAGDTSARPICCSPSIPKIAAAQALALSLSAWAFALSPTHSPNFIH